LHYTIEFHPKAEKDLYHWLKHDKNKLWKAIQLLKAIMEAPFTGIGEPEPLKHKLQGYWSRRINQEHRILYEVDGNAIFVLRCKGHYQ
jgi:toxin YoeB